MHFVLLFFLFSFHSLAETNLHESPKWLRLLHYKKDLFGNYVSEADGKEFFLHPEGKYNPKKELEKSIKLFASSSSPDDDHPICRFPLRYKWLNQQLGGQWNADFSNCKKYVSFFSKLAARRASIIFSSYYLTNPNSAFGHTLLRLSRYDDKNETEMLDYGINYAAKANETNPFLYAVKGLFGGFKGEFAAIPYYYKIREYSDFEFRDLWSYDLKLSFPEVLEMVDHIWELGNTYFDYFYFRENCSYHLLSILEVARPSLNLTSNYDLYSIPADTIRLLKKEGLIEEGKRRESTYSRLKRLSRNLTQEQLKLSKSIAKNPLSTQNKVASLDNIEAAKVLDVSMEAFDYYNFEKILLDDTATKEAKNHILIARAINPVITNSIPLEKEIVESPAVSHSPTRFSLSQKYYSESGKSTAFEMRASLHDLLDPPQGSLKEAQLEVGKISFELRDKDYRDPRLVFDSLTIFNIKNFPEQNFWSSPSAWELDVGGKQLRRPECFDCPAAFVSGSMGNGLQTLEDKLLLAILINGEADLQSQFINNYRVGLGPKLVSRYKFSDKWITAFTSYYHFNTYEHQKLFQDYEWWNVLELRHHLTDRFSVMMNGEAIERDSRWISSFDLGLQYFYE